MTVLIKVDQAAHPAGVPGQAREDLATGVGVTLTAVGGPFLAYQWSIVSKPINITVPVEASSLLASPTANITTMSPIDVAGTYLVQVAVDSGNGLGAGAGDVSRITFYAGPTLATNPLQFPRREMAAFESTEHNVPDAIQPLGNTEGWSREWYRWFAALSGTIDPTAITIARRDASGRLKATAFVTGPQFISAAELSTADATPTPILNVPCSDNALITGQFKVQATTPPFGTSFFNGVEFGTTLAIIAGVLQPAIGVPVVVTNTTYVGPQPTFDFVYAANVLTLRVIGIAATSIKWEASVDFIVQAN